MGKHNTTEDRKSETLNLLMQNPNMSHAAVNKTLKEKYGYGIDFYKFRELKKQAASGEAAEKKAEDVVQAFDATSKKKLKELFAELGKALKSYGIVKVQGTLSDIQTNPDREFTWELTQMRMQMVSF